MFATITEALLALPVGPDAIAEHLTKLGVKAECIDPSKCAIAEYLSRSVTGIEIISVGVDDAENLLLGEQEADPEGRHGERVRFAEISRSDIAEFIGAFDGRLYPQLIAEPVAA